MTPVGHRSHPGIQPPPECWRALFDDADPDNWLLLLVVGKYPCNISRLSMCCKSTNVALGWIHSAPAVFHTHCAPRLPPQRLRIAFQALAAWTHDHHHRGLLVHLAVRLKDQGVLSSLLIAHEWALPASLTIYTFRDSSRSDERMSPLGFAAKSGWDGSVRAILAFLSSRVDPSTMSSPDTREVSTSLNRAVESGHEQCALALLKAGAAVDKTLPSGSTALILAAQDGHEKCVLALIEKADLEKQTKIGNTALILACQNGHEQCALALIEAKADLEKQTAKGSTALIFACQNGHEQCVLELLKAGANVNHSINDGRTALMQAAKNGHEQCVLALIEEKADPNKAADDGFTALMAAAQDGHDQCLLKALIVAGAAVDAVENKQWTALMFAAQNGHEQCAHALIKAGAKPLVNPSDCA